MSKVLKTNQQFSWLGGVDEKGVIIESGHELYGQSIAGKELHFPGASGSTVGSDVIINLAKRGYAPEKIFMEEKDVKKDNITTWGCIIGRVPLIIKNKTKSIDKSQIEKLDIPEEILDSILKASDYLEFKDFIQVTSPVQIAGVSYKTIKDAGLEVREDFSRKFKVKTQAVLNPAGMDLDDWRKQKIPEDFAEKQMRIIRNYEKMEIEPTCTCIPYYTGTIGIPFSEGYWSESSAVSFANSVLGTRTNRESALSSLLWALAGYAPKYGLHLDENRNPQIEIEVDANLESVNDFGTLGNIIGKTVKDKIPYINGIIPSNNLLDKLKSLGAAAAASGSVALYHVENITPEVRAKTISLDKIEEHINLGEKDLLEAKGKLNTGKPEEIDLVAIGCPHASHREVKEVAELLSGKKVKEGTDLIVYTSKATKAWCDRMGYTSEIRRAGGSVCCDTCMVVEPIEAIGYKTTATNSGKAAHYLPTFCKQKVVFDDTKKIIEMVSK